MSSSRTVHVLSVLFLCAVTFQASSEAESWLRIGYWYSGSEFPISEINSALYTHLICAFADVNASSFEISLSSSNQQRFSTFTNTVKLKNPSITTLLSTGGDQNSATIQSMLTNASSRNPFIQSSIAMARLYGFHGLDLSWSTIETSSDADNLGQLFHEWRLAAKSEANNSTLPELFLTAAVQASPDLNYGSYPVDRMRSNLDWVHVNAYSYHTPSTQNFTAAPSALYDPHNTYINTDYYIKAWIGKGLEANKLVLGLPFFGFAWKLQNPDNDKIGALATGPAGGADDGSISYRDIKNSVQQNGAQVVYNGTYVTNYCSFGSTWIGYDDVEVVQNKVSYAREKGLLGYYVWQISHDDQDWTLARAAAEQVDNDKDERWKLIVIILSVIATGVVLGVTIYLRRKRIFKSTGRTLTKPSQSKVNDKEAAGPFHGDAPDLQVYRFSDIEAATDKFSYENKLGQGGYGPVYKGILPDDQEIAVKKLSKASTQGFEEFKNEVTLTARLQHVNLVRLLDPIRRFLLDWSKRINIIEGITQGLLYLQEYSRFTIIHRDLKASNILLDLEMKPKISDFGMARIFTKNELEANTSKIVGTYGYIPPEYVKGVYSTKSDVYSFGVLLLQIISGKKTHHFYGENQDLKLLEYAFELWKEGKGMEFMDDSLDDTCSPCKLMRCMQIALLCVQEHACDRPSILEFSSMLRNENISLTIPKRPAFSKAKDEEEVNECKPLEIISVNDATITEMVAR
uniref:non-specific serine/threonine protein kinase n=1 Tax=Cajanus cajan TaxID=3821 RepID=A0A151QSL2_CAJCA|nr:Cysteine-rich receptor-like protein kinase 10 [Cajanus cajan]